MTIKDLQSSVNKWILGTGSGYFDILTNTCLLQEEVGELSKTIARKYGMQISKDEDKDNIEEEIADVLWVLICIANQKNIDLTNAFENNLVKKNKRDIIRYKI